MKLCPVCDKQKSLEEFYGNKKNRDGRQSYCKKCQNRKRNEWPRPNPDKNRKWNRAHYARLTPERKRDSDLRTKFGISLSQYERMLENQQGCCAACGREAGERRLHVDHDHSCCPGQTGGCGNCVRSLLCLNCNAALGHVQDDIAKLHSLIEYLSAFTG